jgi:hypothetical protein
VNRTLQLHTAAARLKISSQVVLAAWVHYPPRLLTPLYPAFEQVAPKPWRPRSFMIGFCSLINLLQTSQMAVHIATRVSIVKAARKLVMEKQVTETFLSWD